MTPLRTLLVIPVLATLLVPSALASHTVYETASGGASCLLDLCGVTWDHFIYSEPTAYCSGSAGSYSSCNVYHECFADASGIVMTASLSCSFVGADSCGGTGGCSMGVSGLVNIPVNTCRALTLTATVIQPVGGGATSSHSWTVCVDGTGPYVF